MIAARRPLEDMLGEIAGSLLPQLGDGQLRPVSLNIALPMEAQVANTGDGLRVIADVPRAHTRTDFDLPVGRIAISLAVIAAEDAA
jgi:hypothetical protein